MNEMIVATIGLKFDTKYNVTRTSFNFPEGTEILSVHVKNNEPTLWISFMAPSESFEIDISDNISFIICNCKYTKIELTRYKYISNVDIDDNSYAVFYQK